MPTRGFMHALQLKFLTVPQFVKKLTIHRIKYCDSEQIQLPHVHSVHAIVLD